MTPDSGAPAACTSASRILHVVFSRTHLRRTALTAIVVGTWLTMINQWDVLASSGWTAHLALKILMNYLTPFVVANVGLISRKSS